MILVTDAAARGSDAACYVLACLHRDGLSGLDKDPKKAARCFRQMEGCQVKDSPDECRDEAAEWLRQHAGGS